MAKVKDTIQTVRPTDLLLIKRGPADYYDIKHEEYAKNFLQYPTADARQDTLASDTVVVRRNGVDAPVSVEAFGKQYRPTDDASYLVYENGRTGLIPSCSVVVRDNLNNYKATRLSEIGDLVLSRVNIPAAIQFLTYKPTEKAVYIGSPDSSIVFQFDPLKPVMANQMTGTPKITTSLHNIGKASQQLKRGSYETVWSIKNPDAVDYYVTELWSDLNESTNWKWEAGVKLLMNDRVVWTSKNSTEVYGTTAWKLDKPFLWKSNETVTFQLDCRGASYSGTAEPHEDMMNPPYNEPDVKGYNIPQGTYIYTTTASNAVPGILKVMAYTVESQLFSKSIGVASNVIPSDMEKALVPGTIQAQLKALLDGLNSLYELTGNVASEGGANLVKTEDGKFLQWGDLTAMDWVE